MWLAAKIRQSTLRFSNVANAMFSGLGRQLFEAMIAVPLRATGTYGYDDA